MYSYVIKVADSESNLGLHGKALVSEILIFLQIKMTKQTIKNPQKLKNPQNPHKLL